MTFSILRLSEVSNQSMLPETSETIEASQTLETLDTSDFFGLLQLLIPLKLPKCPRRLKLLRPLKLWSHSDLLTLVTLSNPWQHLETLQSSVAAPGAGAPYTAWDHLSLLVPPSSF